MAGAFFAKHAFTGSLFSKENATNLLVTTENDLSAWSEASKTAVKRMRIKYGEPDEITKSMMVWKNNGPWKKTVIYSESVNHNFPIPHSDVIQQFVHFKVPAGKLDELSLFNGSIEYNRTSGDISATCDKEEANILTLNLAHELILGNINVSAARKMYAESVLQLSRGEKPGISTQLKFQNVNFSGDPDVKGILYSMENLTK